LGQIALDLKIRVLEETLRRESQKKLRVPTGVAQPTPESVATLALKNWKF